MKTVFLAIGIIATSLAVLGLAIQDLYLVRKIRSFEKKNDDLRRENIGLMKHNGKLYDENYRLKTGIDSDNIPTFDEW